MMKALSGVSGAMLLTALLANPAQAGSLWESEMTCIILPGAFGDARGDAEIKNDGELRAEIKNLPPNTFFDCVITCGVTLQSNRVDACGTTDDTGRLIVRVEDFASAAALGTFECVGIDVRLFKSGGGISCISGFPPPQEFP